jgi:hypothetical protein
LCDVTIRLDDGRAIHGHCSVMKGEPANPHNAEEIEGKFYALTQPVWGRDSARKLYRALLSLENAQDLRTFGAEFAL